MGRSIGFRCIRPFELRGKEPPDPAYVSSSPSKIPYGGFSPVRLQTGLQPLRPSPAWRGLSDRPACTCAQLAYTQPSALHRTPLALAGMCAGPIVRAFQSRGPWLANRFYCPAGSSLTMASSAPLHPSCRFMDYAAGLRPTICSGLGSRGSPIYSACLSLRAVFHTPLDRKGAFDRFFPSRIGLHQFGNVSASKFATQSDSTWGFNEAAKFTSCYGPAGLLALHRSGLLLSSFRSLCRHRKRRV